ncbi:Alpha-adducin [Portunus trituberculatus]|uniref:Alpha-adducin n=1 Tax=Portunus trituberculatus TaxID=210409 RepID=A0A5B7DW45_PORTR|nr:Alpha-adducin [Portunus trituberculatus]
MERRKRVEAIMNSTIFREELEKIVESQLTEGYSGYQAIQNISEMMGIPCSRVNTFRSMSSVIPINDIRGMESLNFVKGEKLLRCKLASVYRLIDMHGWTQSIYNHVTARISQDTEHFLLNPFGMLYHEVTASSLVKVDMQGNIVESGSTNFGVSVAGFMLHSAIHAARPDIKCIIHLHHPAVVAVSALKQGLMSLSQESLLIGDISYHEYQGIFVNQEERDKLARNLGPINKVMLLRNHGVVCCGETIEEAWYNTYHTILACETQEGGPTGQGPKERKWKVGELEFEALMSPLKRILDGRKVQDKSRWLNSPNVYQKVEVLETGTPDPKKITKVEIITSENLIK